MQESLNLNRPWIEIPTFFKPHNNGLTITESDGSYKVHHCEMVDFPTLRRHLEYLMTLNAGGLLVTHAKAEPSTLSEKEQLKIIKLAIEVANGKVPVMAGVSSNSTATAIELSLGAKKFGATALLHALPYYNNPPIEGIKLHLRTIREQVPGIPIFLSYNITRSNSKIDLKTILELVREKTINGMFIEDGDPELINSLLEKLADDFPVFSTDRLMYLLMRLGADCVISNIANFDFGRIEQLFYMLKNADYAKAKKQVSQLELMAATMRHTTSPIALKTIMSMLDSRYLECFRPPLCKMDAKLRSCLIGMLRHCGITKFYQPNR